MNAFVDDSGIGVRQGSSILFMPAHKVRICDWLRADSIDPATPADAWSGVSRRAALELGPDEKWAGLAVRANRIVLKALPGRPLQWGREAILIPPRANLEWDIGEAIDGLSHDAVIVIENWEVFEHIDELDLDFGPAGDNPLILWRGGAHTSIGASMEFLKGYGRPVWSAPDYDPEGLAIALRLPHLAGVLAPAENVLRAMLTTSRLQKRYLAQLQGAQAVLEQARHPDVRRLWAIVKSCRNALPQERLRKPLQAKAAGR
ncbi:hypothetical protein RugamoR57_03440 [Duganella caerulea]